MEIIKDGDIVFARNDGFVSRFIRARTLSQWSHVGIVTGRYNGSIKCISAKWNGVEYDNVKDWIGNKQVLRVKDITEHQIEIMINYAISQVGKPYGWCGLKDFITTQRYQSGVRWFSSVLVYCALLHAEIDIDNNKPCSSFITPGELYESPLLEFVANI